MAVRRGSRFEPIFITDLPLRPTPDDLVRLAAGKPHLVLFWSDEIPVGQLWIEAEEGPRAAVEAFLAAFTPPERPLAQAPPPANASLVICTRDRPDELARCLASLPAQTRTPDEVIVVDNASVDQRTRQVAERAGVRYIREDRAGLDIARNTGAMAAQSQIVAYTDDDTALDPHWLENLVAAFDRPDIMAVTGLVLPAELNFEAQWLFETVWGFGRGFSRIDFGRDFYQASATQPCPVWTIGAGASMAFRRECFDAVGLFDERLDVGAAGCSGDSEYWYRVLAAGYTCRYEPAAVLRHFHRSTMAGLEKQIHAYMRGHVASLMVQYERTGDRRNLRRAFVSLPLYFAQLVPECLSRSPSPGSRMLGRQVSGSISGLVYYLKGSVLERHS